MLTLIIPAVDNFDDETQMFIIEEEVTLELEHSLVSLSKWESEFEKPFLGPEQKSTEEVLSYIKAMCLTPNVSPEVFERLNNDHLKQVNTYIEAKMSATWFNEKPGASKGRGREIVTAEILYYWMIALNIPLEWENRHLGRLFTLIKVCNEKNDPKKKTMNKRDMVAERNRINAERKAKLNTSG